MKIVLKSITTIFIFICSNNAFPTYASTPSQFSKSHFTLEFRNNDILIGTLWLAAEFRYDENSVEVTDFDKGFTQLTEDDQYIFNNHKINFQTDPETKHARVSAFLDVSTTSLSGITVSAAGEHRVYEYLESMGHSPFPEPPLIFDKRRIRIFLECNRQGRIATGWGQRQPPVQISLGR